MVAISGGKDSLAVWDILTELGFKADGLYINLGISQEDYSDKSQNYAKGFASSKALKLFIVNIAEELGKSIPQKAKETWRNVCSLCGLTKRYFMNKVAYENGYDVVITGHNLDDQSSALLSNLFRWDLNYLSSGGPFQPSVLPNLVAKAKPLVLCTERQMAAYCILRGISYIQQECPFSEDATFLKLKEVINKAEQISPGTKQRFYTGYVDNIDIFEEALKKKGRYVENTSQKMDYRCKRCGMPTFSEFCSFCKTWYPDDVKRIQQRGLDE